MPDHEEAVREAREALLMWANQLEYWAGLDTYESAIRASERAKYAALVEMAAEVWSGLEVMLIASMLGERTYSAAEWRRAANDSYDLLRAPLAALQSKEGTNE